MVDQILKLNVQHKIQKNVILEVFLAKREKICSHSIFKMIVKVFGDVDESLNESIETIHPVSIS
jgi:hypothetical protein